MCYEESTSVELFVYIGRRQWGMELDGRLWSNELEEHLEYERLTKSGSYHPPGYEGDDIGDPAGSVRLLIHNRSR